MGHGNPRKEVKVQWASGQHGKKWQRTDPQAQQKVKAKQKDYESPKKKVKPNGPTWQEMAANRPIGTTRGKSKANRP